jgi:hypothetical protein
MLGMMMMINPSVMMAGIWGHDVDVECLLAAEAIIDAF